MRDIPAELLLVLGIAAIVLFQYLRRHARRRLRSHAATVEQVSKNVDRTKARAPGGSTPVAAMRSLAATGTRPSGYRSLLRNRHDARKAIVAATMLGPCRAFEPYRPPLP